MNLCGFDAGNDQGIFLIAGTCVVESEQMAIDTAATLKEIRRIWASPSSTSRLLTRQTVHLPTVFAVPEWRRAFGSWAR